MLLIFSVILDLVLHFIDNFVIIYKVRKIIMIKIFMSFVFIMLISLPSVLAYSPQDNFVQQNMYEITGTYLGQTVDELKQQNLLIENSYGVASVPLKTVGIAGVIFKKETIANIANDKLCSLMIEFDSKDIEKTKKLQAYFVNKLGQPTFINQPTEIEKKFNIIAESYTWEIGTYHLTVGQGDMSFSEENLSREVMIQSTIGYIKYCQGYMEYSKGNSNTQNMYYVGERGKKAFEAGMKTAIDSFKQSFAKDAELANYVKTYFADKPEYAETLKLFFE